MTRASDHADWLTLQELLPFCGASLPASARALAEHAERAGWRNDPARARTRAGRGGGYEYHVSLFPADVRGAIALSRRAASVPAASRAEAASKELWARFERLSESARATARQRLSAIEAVEIYGSALTRGAAVTQVAAMFEISPSSLWSWLSLVDDTPKCDRLPALAPRHAGRTATAECDPRAWDMLIADYLRLEAPAFEACHRRMIEAAAHHGWGPIPSAKTLKRRIEREMPRGVQVLARKGVDAARRSLPAQRRDRSIFAACQAVNADGHKFDVWVKWEDGSIGRPIMVAFQDLFSGMVLSHRIDRTENQDLVRLAFADLTRDFGIPEHAYLDNGRAFASKWLTGRMTTRFRFKIVDDEPEGIFKALGVEVHWATPFHGQAKPIERAFRDMCEDIAKHPEFAGAWTGNTPLAKPENYGSVAVPIARFRAVVAREIDRHNARPGRSSPTAQGRSFRATYEESLAQATLPPRKASDAQRRMLLMAAEGVVARKPTGEIHLHDTRYWDEALADRIGEKLIVRFDPQDLTQPLAVYTRDNRFLCTAEPLGDVRFNSTEDARDWARLNRDRLKGIKQQLEAERRMDAAAVARLLPDAEPEAPPETRVVRLVGARVAASGGGWSGSEDFARGAALMAEGQIVPFVRDEAS